MAEITLAPIDNTTTQTAVISIVIHLSEIDMTSAPLIH